MSNMDQNIHMVKNKTRNHWIVNITNITEKALYRIKHVTNT